jgi:ankyrin repeat protein
MRKLRPLDVASSQECYRVVSRYDVGVCLFQLRHLIRDEIISLACDIYLMRILRPLDMASTLSGVCADGIEVRRACVLVCLSQLHHLIRVGAEVNQRDQKGMTALHRAAFLAQYEGYLEIYEYLLVRITIHVHWNLRTAYVE